MTIYGKAVVSEAALAYMKKLGDNWYAYQNVNYGSGMAGHLKYFQCGSKETPPTTMPGEVHYTLVGKVNLSLGAIEEISK